MNVLFKGTKPLLKGFNTAMFTYSGAKRLRNKNWKNHLHLVSVFGLGETLDALILF